MLQMKQRLMLEQLVDVSVFGEEHERWIASLLINEPDLTEQEDTKLKELYQEAFGYGYEGSNVA